MRGEKKKKKGIVARYLFQLWGANEAITSCTMWAVVRRPLWLRRIHVWSEGSADVSPQCDLECLYTRFAKQREVNCAELHPHLHIRPYITNQEAATTAVCSVYICRRAPLSRGCSFFSIYCLGISQRKAALPPGLVNPGNSRIDPGMPKNI